MQSPLPFQDILHFQDSTFYECLAHLIYGNEKLNIYETSSVCNHAKLNSSAIYF